MKRTSIAMSEPPPCVELSIELPIELWHLVLVNVTLFDDVMNCALVCTSWRDAIERCTTKFTDHSPRRLTAHALMRFKRLHSLRFDFSTATPGERTKLCRMVAAHGHLRVVDFNDRNRIITTTPESYEFVNAARELTALRLVDACSEPHVRATLINLSRLTVLDLAEANGIAHVRFDRLTSLTALNLCGIVANSFDVGTLTSLTALDVGCSSDYDECKIAGVYALTRLRFLSLCNNLSVTDDDLALLTGLTHLDLSGACAVTKIAHLTNLTYLNLSRNKTIVPAEVRALYDLRYLLLRFNNAFAGERLSTHVRVCRCFQPVRWNYFDHELLSSLGYDHPEAVTCFGRSCGTEQPWIIAFELPAWF